MNGGSRDFVNGLILFSYIPLFIEIWRTTGQDRIIKERDHNIQPLIPRKTIQGYLDFITSLTFNTI